MTIKKISKKLVAALALGTALMIQVSPASALSPKVGTQKVIKIDFESRTITTKSSNGAVETYTGCTLTGPVLPTRVELLLRTAKCSGVSGII